MKEPADILLVYFFVGDEDVEKNAEFLFSQEIRPYIIPKEQVVIADPNWSLERALIVLSRKSTNSVPVINEKDEVEGLISKSNILDFMFERQGAVLEDRRKKFSSNQGQRWDMAELSEFQVRDAMDLHHGGILENSIFSFAFEVLVNRSYVPIIDYQSQFLGILTRKVMMEKVIGHFRQEFFESITED